MTKAHRVGGNISFQIGGRFLTMNRMYITRHLLFSDNTAQSKQSSVLCNRCVFTFRGTPHDIGRSKLTLSSSFTTVGSSDKCHDCVKFLHQAITSYKENKEKTLTFHP